MGRVWNGYEGRVWGMVWIFCLFFTFALEGGEGGGWEGVLSRIRAQERGWLKLEAVWALRELGAGAQSALIDALKNRDVDVRVEAALALGAVGGREAFGALLGALEDREPEVRLAALQGMDRLRGDVRLDSFVSAVARCLRDGDADVRLEAVRILGRLDASVPGVISALIQALRSGDVDVRVEAVDALVRMGDASGISALISRLEREKEEVVRLELVLGLSRLAETSFSSLALSALLKRVRDSSPWVRRAVARGLGEFGKRGLSGLMELSVDGESWVRLEAIWALERLGMAGFGVLLRGLSSRDAQVRKESLRVLSLLDPVPSSLSSLVQRMLRDKDVDVRVEAAVAAGRVGALEALGEALGDREVWVRIEAVRALGRLGQRGLTYLLKALKDGDSFVRIEAVRALGSFRGGERKVVFSALLGALRDEEGDVRLEVVRSLAQLGLSGALLRSALGLALRDGDGDVRREAARVMGRLGRSFVSDLYGLSRDLDILVRLQAVDSMGRLGGDVVVSYLTKVWEVGKEDVRREVVLVLAELEGEFIQSILLRALGDRSADVRVVAAWAVGRVGLQAQAELSRLLQDGDGWVREAAVRSLGRLGKLGHSVLYRVLGESGDANVRLEAVVALWRWRSVYSYGGLLRALRDRDAEVRREAVYGLARMGQKASLALVEALRDRDAEVRREAVYGLARMGGSGVAALLRGDLRRQDELTRLEIALALGRVGISGRSVLLEFLERDKSVLVQREAALSLAQMEGGSAVLSTLARGLERLDEEVRRSIVVALLARGSGRVVRNLLVQALLDVRQFWWVKLELIWGLAQGKSDSSLVISALAKVLQEGRDVELKREAVYALSRLGSSGAVRSYLLWALKNGAVEVRLEAAKALGRLGDISAIGGLREIVGN